MNPVASRSFNLVSHGGKFTNQKKKKYMYKYTSIYFIYFLELIRDPLFFNEIMKIVTGEI